MIYPNDIAKKVDYVDNMHLHSLGYGFGIDLNMTYQPMSPYPTWTLFYRDIAFEDIERDFISFFSILLSGFSHGIKYQKREYPISKSLRLKTVLMDDSPAIRCTIIYHREENEDEELEEEVILDQAGANALAKNLEYALTLMRPRLIQHM